MKNTLILTKNQTQFLEENRQDPITGDDFSVGDEIVFCASCKSAFLKESWEFMDRKHCNQKKILRSFPSYEKLFLEKPKAVLSYQSAEMESRLPAVFIDIIFTCFVCLFFMPVFWFLNIFNKLPFLENAYIYLGIGLFIFRDTILVNKSLGKHIMQLCFIHSNTQKKAPFYKIFLRNSLLWITFTPLVYLFILTNSLFLLLLIIFGSISYCLFFITQNQSLLDKLLRIELVQKKVSNK
ncbi:RDD family protein [Bernardetia sp. ABR2-2B]|uniref:RDD family protein n=1 Tax=Bernardetia sp. ABR2-2B TaxID=3127472 RepID=UPI0030CFA248